MEGKSSDLGLSGDQAGPYHIQCRINKRSNCYN